MSRLARAAVVCALCDELTNRGSWCGETHVQKATYILQELFDVPNHYEFTLYKYGPFSFDLRDELSELQADQLIALAPQPYPYGPRLATTPLSQALSAKYPKTLRAHENAITEVARIVGSHGVAWLEAHATALMLWRDLPNASIEQIADQLRSVKPHVSQATAIEAVKRATSWTEAAEALH